MIKITKNERRILVDSFNFILKQIQSQPRKHDHYKLFKRVLKDCEIKSESKFSVFLEGLNNE